MRDRLIEIVESARYWGANTSADIADRLLAEGVIVPPCKVGDKVYYVCKVFEEVCKGRVIEIRINLFTTPKMWFSIEYDSKFIGRQVCNGNDVFGKTLFLTKEEAERALEGAEK